MSTAACSLSWREIVVHDLRGRNLELHHTMIRRAAAHLLDALEGAGERAALSAVGDTIYTLRHEPYVKRLFPFRDARCYPDSAGADEIPALKAEVARLEGDESAAWFEYWLGRTGTNVLVMRDSARQPVAMAATICFGRAAVAAGSEDPCVQALFRLFAPASTFRAPRKLCAKQAYPCIRKNGGLPSFEELRDIHT